MAPELRTRKKSAPATAAQKPAAETKSSPAAKRKASEDTSPVAPKKTKSLKAAKVPKISKPVAREVTPDEDEEDDDQALALAGELASDDEDDMVDADAAFKEGQDVGKAPKPSRAIEIAAKAGKDEQEDTGVVYIGRIPHGFFEHQMKSYFEQFGEITNLRLSRNKKTGASKHYAFVEFAEESTAEIVAKTMDNYLLFGHLLKCKLVPKSQVHDSLWKGANKRWKKWDHTKRAGNELKKPRSESKWAASISRENQKRADKAKKLKEMGYEFEAPQLADAIHVPKDTTVPEIDEGSAPEAIEAAPETAEAKEDDGIESLDGHAVVGKAVQTAGKQNGAKGGKKTKQASKPKKAKA